MNLRRAGKGIVRKGKRPSVYRIGFNDGDETELTANGINELEELWRSLCPEFECEPDSVNYVKPRKNGDSGILKYGMRTGRALNSIS